MAHRFLYRMQTLSYTDMLKHYGLRDTQARRMIIDALQRLKAMSAYDIQKWITRKNNAINVVTVYRSLAAFEKIGLVHRHPCNGAFSLCSIPGKEGHHGFLHCNSCGDTQEFCDTELCRAENRIARSAKFRPVSHVSEIVGLCSSCVA